MMEMNLFLFVRPVVQPEEMIENLKLIEKRYLDKDHISMISSFHSNWENGDRIHIVTFVFEKRENKLQAAKQLLEELKYSDDDFVRGQAEVVKHLISILRSNDI